MHRTTTFMLGIVLVLSFLGIVMLASASPLYVRGAPFLHDPYLKRQLISLALGIVLALVAARIPPAWWRRMAVPVAIGVAGILVLVLLPSVGKEVNGSRRWLALGPLTLQPSELAKPAMVFLVAWWMSRIQRCAHELRAGVVIPLAMAALLIGLVFAEPDFGTTMLLGCVTFAMLFAGGARLGYLAIFGTAGAALFAVAILHNEVRMRRILAFLDPERYADKEAYQLMQALNAFAVGGGPGMGLGNSMQKRYYLPEAHTDFIFAILGEELGLAASLGVVLLFGAFLFCGLRIAARAADSFSRLAAFGLTLAISLQAALNIGVVTGRLPTKGLPLPFISYGGTSLMVTLFMVGLLVAIAASAQRTNQTSGELPAIKDRARRV